ncbi:hypothetical protein [Ectobacillus sp. sgz5001026]|uniref:hypothetical protein n=1 Tax=Ectobacillus sp. sgz5001026 TaxID=3242473 RepID=UPI0036D2DC8E
MRKKVVRKPILPSYLNRKAQRSVSSVIRTQEMNAMIADAFNLKELLKDSRVLPVNEKGQYILDPNNASDRDWIED